MILAFLSARLRRWVLLVVVLPLVGRVLEAVGVRLPGRAGRVVGRGGSVLRGPQTRRRGYRL